MNEQDLERWLHEANQRYRQAEVAPIGRVFLAMDEYAREFRCPVSMGSPLANRMNEWFVANTKAGTHFFSDLFTGAYYFDACFWALQVKIGYGMVGSAEGPPGDLKGMPAKLQDEIWNDTRERTLFLDYWADCMDYGFGFDDIEKLENLSPFAWSLFENARRELDGAIMQLNDPRPNSKAILGLRMATEICFKSLLAQEWKLVDEKPLVKLSHRVHDAAAECFKATGWPVFDGLITGVAIFPKVEERYLGPEWPLRRVWEGVQVAQRAMAAVTRFYSDRDTRKELQNFFP